MEQLKASSHLVVLQSLYAAYDQFNAFFHPKEEDRLPVPVINLGPAGRKAAYGWFRASSWFPVVKQNSDPGEVDDSTALPEINISPEYLYRKPEDVLETLLHEMAHLKNNVLGVKDCNKAQYHNKKFKEQAEFFGLKVEKMRNKGWALTCLDEKGKAAIAALTFDKDVFKLSRPRLLVAAENPYITIVLKKADWEETLEELKMELGEEGNGAVVKAALRLLATEHNCTSCVGLLGEDEE
jgi:hypothetical protein